MNIQMNEELLVLFNRQVGREIGSDHIYRQMSSVYQDMSYEGFASWFKKQAEEEHKHSLMFSEFIEDHGNIVKYEDIPKPKLASEEGKDITILSMMKQTVEHEIFIRDSIHEIMDKALAVKDYGAFAFLEGFAKEQVEEINSVDVIYRQVMKCADCDEGLLIIDNRLATR
jgi:ferritin